jgi:hypothetical protein
MAKGCSLWKGEVINEFLNNDRHHLMAKGCSLWTGEVINEFLTLIGLDRIRISVDKCKVIYTLYD